MMAFTASCLVHRAEVLRLEGAWREALAEAERAYRDASRYGCKPQPGLALLQLAQGRARLRRRRSGGSSA